MTRCDVPDHLIQAAVGADVERSKHIARRRDASWRGEAENPAILMDRGAMAWKTMEDCPIAPIAAVYTIRPTYFEAVVDNRPIKAVAALAPDEAHNATGRNDPVQGEDGENGPAKVHRDK